MACAMASGNRNGRGIVRFDSHNSTPKSHSTNYHNSKNHQLKSIPVNPEAIEWQVGKPEGIDTTVRFDSHKSTPKIYSTNCRKSKNHQLK